MKRQIREQISDEKLFHQVALNGAVPDKDALTEALEIIENTHKRAAVSRAYRNSHQQKLQVQFENASAPEQVRIINRLSKLARLISGAS